MRVQKTDLRVLGIAAAIGAAIALPVGIFVGRSGGVADAPGAAAERASPGMRDVYSPGFRSDPYVIEEQRRVADALEQSCRQSRLYCEEAHQARERIREAAAGQ